MIEAHGGTGFESEKSLSIFAPIVNRLYPIATTEIEFNLRSMVGRVWTVCMIIC